LANASGPYASMGRVESLVTGGVPSVSSRAVRDAAK
jgi:hypothetical protein